MKFMPPLFTAKKSVLSVVAGALGCVLFPCSASASLVAHDDFQYDISGGAGLAGKGSAGSGWEGAWAAAGSATLVADSMAYTGGSLSIQGGGQSLRIVGSDNAYFFRQFTAITGVSEVYFSFLFKPVVSGAGGDYLNFWLSENADRANSAGIGDVASSRAFGVRVFGDDTGVNNGVQSASTYVAGSVYFLVGRVSTSGTSGAAGNVFDKIELWVNPTSTTLGEPLLSSDVSTLVTTSVGLSFFGLQSSSVGSGDDYRIDEFRVGTDATSVLVAIPEPSTYAAILGGLALMVAVRAFPRTERVAVITPHVHR